MLGPPAQKPSPAPGGSITTVDGPSVRARVIRSMGVTARAYESLSADADTTTHDQQLSKEHRRRDGYPFAMTIPPHQRRGRERGGAVCSTPCPVRECFWCAAARLTSCASPALPVVTPPDTRRSPALGCRAGAWVRRAQLCA